MQAPEALHKLIGRGLSLRDIASLLENRGQTVHYSTLSRISTGATRKVKPKIEVELVKLAGGRK